MSFSSSAYWHIGQNLLTSIEVVRLSLHRTYAGLLQQILISTVLHRITIKGSLLTIQTIHSTISQYSSLSYLNDILLPLSYFSHRYS